MMTLNRNQIKYIVIIAMVIDHIAWAFVPTGTLLGQLMHFVGRLTGPTMAYFLAEGYLHTQNIKQYAVRLGVFAVLSWGAFCFFEYGVLPIMIRPAGTVSRIGVALFTTSNHTVFLFPFFGVIYTLFLSLLAIWLWDKAPFLVWGRLAGVLLLCLLSRWGDWSYFGVLYAFTFFVLRNEPKWKWTAFSLITACIVLLPLLMQRWTLLFQSGIFLVPLLLSRYNGESGSKAPVHKWFFYAFYPAHLMILGILRWLI